MKILVTGACGVTSRSVTRGLRRDCSAKLEIIGAGIFENQYALYEGIYDKTAILPTYKSPEYSDRLNDLLEKENFDAALIIPEPEVAVWAKEKFNVPNLIPNSCIISNLSDKRILNLLLNHTQNVPKSKFISKEDAHDAMESWNIYPCWVRPVYFGVTSGRGAAKCSNKEMVLRHVDESMYSSVWQISEFVSGRNIAVSLLYNNSELIDAAMYERLEYFQGSLFESGVSGNISKGKIFHDNNILEQITSLIKTVTAKLQTEVDGFITVDLLLDDDQIAKVTEVNVRPTAPVEAYSLANIPIIGNWLEQILSSDLTTAMPDRKIPSYIFRDIDGQILVKEAHDLQID